MLLGVTKAAGLREAQAPRVHRQVRRVGRYDDDDRGEQTPGPGRKARAERGPLRSATSVTKTMKGAEDASLLARRPRVGHTPTR